MLYSTQDKEKCLPRMAGIERNKVHVATTWVSLEKTVLSERSQTQKDKWYTNPLI